MRRFLTVGTLLCLIPVLGWTTASDFNATTSLVTITHASAIASTDMTVGCWTYRDTLGEANLGRVLEKNGRWNILNYNNPGAVVEFNSIGGWTTAGSWMVTAPAASEWHHIAVAYDASSTTNDPDIYIDAVLQTETENSNPVGTYADTAGDLIIGNNTAVTRTFDGRLASCFYYDRKLTVNEIKQVMRCGPPSIRNGLIGYWPLGLFGGGNFTASTGINGTETAITVSATGPPVSAPQGGLCDY